MRLYKGISAIFDGLFTVFKHAFRKPVTLEYPEVRPQLNNRFRGRLCFRLDEEGHNYCIACGLCQKVCPPFKVIDIEKERHERGFKPTSYKVDLARCIFCGNCVNVCPTNALLMTQDFELASESLQDLVIQLKEDN